MFPKIKRKDWSILQTDCPQCLKALNNYYHLTLGSLYTVTQRHWPYRQTKLQTIFLSWCSILSVQFSHAQHFESPWTADQQASLSITNSWSFLKLESIELVMPSNHLVLCHPLLLQPSIFPSIRVFSNKSVFPLGGQRIGVSASASVLPMNIQDLFL